MLHSFLLLTLCPFTMAEPQSALDLPADYVAGPLVRLNDNGAWSWFMDERVVVWQRKLIVGSVRSIGSFEDGKADPDWGNVEVSTLDLATGEVARAILDRHFEQDDHDNPAFLPLPEGRLLAVYTRHNVDRKVFTRLSEPNNPLAWGPPMIFETPGGGARGGADNVTYSNLFRFPDGKLYNFHRGYDHDPNYLVSNDDGRSWRYGGRVLRGKDGYSPYMKYAFDGKGTLHFITTEDHPRNFDNSIYHGFLRNGVLHLSNGQPLAPLSQTTEPSANAWDFTRVFQGDPDNVAWTVDLELDSKAQPVAVFSVQKDGRGLPPRQGGFDLRFHYARWNGQRWLEHPMAFAGTRLYPFEDDYSGLAAIDPRQTNLVYISTDAHPLTGEPLISRADGQRHRELFRGETSDDGASWHWQPITANSTADNLRPIVPKSDDPRTALVWMRGSYLHNHGEWTTSVVALLLPSDESK